MKFLSLEKNGKIYHLWIQKDKARLWIHYQGSTWVWDSQKIPKNFNTEKQELKTAFFAPMAGQVLKVSVKKNDKVKKGQTLLVLSAMKMEYVFRAEATGKIKAVNCKEGDSVESNKLLMEIDYA